VTAGGTGGHIYPALSVLDELRKRISPTILFVGTKRGLEARLVPDRGYRFRTVWVSGLRRRRFWANCGVPLKMAVSLIQSMAIIIRFRPELILGTGGYASWPVMTAGILLGRKTMIQEQNRRPGLVTRLLAPWVDVVELSWQESVRHFRKGGNLRVSGNPTREDIEGVKRTEACLRFGLRPDRLILLVFGGSQGAESINRALAGFLDDLMAETEVQILWATGPAWVDWHRPAVQRFKERIRLVPYIDDMAAAYAAADLVVSRSGASTVAEITRLGLPSCLIPFPGAAGGHQEQNARMLSDADAAVLVHEPDMTEGLLAKHLYELLSDPDRRKSMAEKAKTFGRPDAAQRICDDLMELAKGSSVSGER